MENELQILSSKKFGQKEQQEHLSMKKGKFDHLPESYY